MQRAIGHSHYLVSELSHDPCTGHPGVLFVSLTLSGPVQTSIYSTLADKPGTHTLDVKGIYQCVKRSKRAGDHDSFLLARNVPVSKGLKVELVSIQYASGPAITTIFGQSLDRKEYCTQIQVVVCAPPSISVPTIYFWSSRNSDN